MRAEPLGDSAYILRDLSLPAYQAAEFMNSQPPPGLIEAVASYDTVGLYVDPETFDLASLQFPAALPPFETRVMQHVIPVCYELGEDTADVCKTLSISPEQLVLLHSSQSFRCYAVGFCPGFAYLGHLPGPLTGIPRRAAPRLSVEPGSVAITGDQTAVYPLERPGGWALIGKTPLCLVDVDEGYFPIKAGDQVRFRPIGEEEYKARRGERL